MFVLVGRKTHRSGNGRRWRPDQGWQPAASRAAAAHLQSRGRARPVCSSPFESPRATRRPVAATTARAPCPGFLEERWRPHALGLCDSPTAAWLPPLFLLVRPLLDARGRRLLLASGVPADLSLGLPAKAPLSPCRSKRRPPPSVTFLGFHARVRKRNKRKTNGEKNEKEE